MGKGKEGMVRFRLFFDDHRLLNNSQLSDGQGRCWLLLKPSIATFADLASHLCKKFALRDRLVLCIGDFVLPPFVSTCIIKEEDIIRVKQKNVKSKDVCKPCDTNNLVPDFKTTMAHSLTNGHINASENSDETPQGHMKNETAAHDSSLSLDILVPKEKREHPLELHNSVKRRKYGCTEKQVTTIGVECVHTRQNRNCEISCGSKMTLHAKAKAHDHGLVVDVSGAEINLGKEVPASSIPCKESRQQPEGINKGLESELNTACGVTKEYARFSSVTSNGEQIQFSKESFKGKDGYDLLEKKPEEDFPDKIATTNICKIDFSTLFPLTWSPRKGDILAYRYVVPSSMAYPELSSPQVGKVSAFDNKSSAIVLVKVFEFEVFSEVNSNSRMLLQSVSPYNEDGFLEINLSALIDVRLLKAHDSEEIACLPERTLNRMKENWKVGSAKNNWNHLEPHYIGWGNGSKYITNERASSSWIYGESPAAALFWETVLSKGAFGKAGKCSGPAKF